MASLNNNTKQLQIKLCFHIGWGTSWLDTRFGIPHFYQLSERLGGASSESITESTSVPSTVCRFKLR